LDPGVPHSLVFRFSFHAERVRARLLYRRFWPEVSEAKSWPDDTVLIKEEEWAAPARK
jgi:hypothetical protein